MKKEIKLTQKQQQVLETLGNMLEKENFNKIPVSDIYCNMTAVKQIVKPNWFDRTFNKLEELNLVKKADMRYKIKGGFKKGGIIETYAYILTELGFKYLGITNPDNQNEQEMKTIEIMKFDGTLTTTEVYETYEWVIGEMTYNLVYDEDGDLIAVDTYGIPKDILDDIVNRLYAYDFPGTMLAYENC